MVHDDDRDNPITERGRFPSRRRASIVGRHRGGSRNSELGQESPNKVYRCPGRTANNLRCKRTKRGEPGFVCHDHIGRRW